jgi:hypothetical protein
LHFALTILHSRAPIHPDAVLNFALVTLNCARSARPARQFSVISSQFKVTACRGARRQRQLGAIHHNAVSHFALTILHSRAPIHPDAVLNFALVTLNCARSALPARQFSVVSSPFKVPACRGPRLSAATRRDPRQCRFAFCIDHFAFARRSTPMPF